MSAQGSVLQAGDLTLDELRELLGAVSVHGSEPTRIWLETADGWSLAWWRGLAGEVPFCRAGHESRDVPVADLVTRAQAGRLFAPSGELRWRALPSLGERSRRAVFLGRHVWAASLMADCSEELPPDE